MQFLYLQLLIKAIINKFKKIFETIKKTQEKWLLYLQIQSFCLLFFQSIKSLVIDGQKNCYLQRLHNEVFNMTL